MSRWLKRSLITVAVIVGFLLVSMLVVPWQVKKQGSAWIAENTERILTIDKVYFNPFSLKLQLSGVTLSEPGSAQAFVAWDRLMIALSLRSVFDQALILRRIEIDHPYVRIDLLGQQKFNFSDFMHLGADTPTPEPVAAAEESGPFLFSFNNIVISAGEIDFNDQASAQHSHHEIRQLELSVPVVGNVAYLADEYVTPELSMLLNGADIHAQGQSKPFSNTLETELSLTLFNTDLAYYATNSPVPLPVELKSGVLDCEINFAYLLTPDALPKLLLDGCFVLSNLVVNEPEGTPLFAMPTLLVDVERADVFNNDIVLSRIALQEPHLSLCRDTRGQLNLLRLFSAPVPPTEEPAAPAHEEESRLPLLALHNLTLDGGRISFRDQSLKTPVEEQIHALYMTLENLSTHPEQRAVLDLRLQTGRQLDVAVNGQFGVVPPRAELDFSANGLDLEPYYPYLEQLLSAPVSGQADLSAQMTYADGNTVVHDGALTLRNLLVPFSGKDRLTLEQLQLSGTAVDVNEQQIHLGQLRLHNGDVKATRLADGSFSPQKLLRPGPADTKPPSAPASPAAKPWSLDLERFDLVAFNLQLRDETNPRKPLLQVRQIGVHAEHLSYPKARKSPFELTANVGDKGDVRVKGSVVHTPLDLTSTARVKALSLYDFNDFIPPGLKFKVKDGQLFSTLNLHLKQQRDALKGTFSGDVSVQHFNLLDAQGGELVRWGGLNLSGIQGDVAPFALHIKEVALNDYQANIEIAADGRINLTSVSGAEQGGAEAAPQAEAEGEKAAAVEAAEEEGGKTPADIRIDAVTLQGGTVSFTDRHLPRTFATTMYELGGRISGLASDESMQADVDLRGQLENSSPLTITGKLNPLSRDLFADLSISFKDIDLSPLTPYSGTYLGYAIDKGKLYLDLNYNIEHQQIEADNKVLIDQFTFGDTIDSEEATSLPVAFAISLLKDRNDEIHLDIPVSGNLNDPDFSLAGTIFTVLRNLLVKAATSPFALLSAMVGGGEDVSIITFEPGRANIPEEQAQIVADLAEILSKRPSLILEISPYADQDNDPEAYRQQRFTAMLQSSKWDELSKDQRKSVTAQEVEISAEEYPKVLKQVYKDAEFPRPRNVIGLLKSLPPEEMEKLLLANIRAGDEEMAALAKARAMAVRDALLGIDPELKPRLFLMSTDIYAVPEEGPASRVEFGINAK